MISDIDQRIKRFVAGIRQAFRGVLGPVNSAGAVQLVQVNGLADETVPDTELFQQYGFTSNPPAGTMAVILPIGGKTSHGIVVATEHGSYRLKGLKTGEMALYTDEGDSIVLARGRVININTQTLNITADQAVNITTPQLTVSNKLDAKGQITGSGGMAISGGGDHALAVDGSMNVTQDVAVGGKSIAHHKHPYSGGETGEMD